MHGCVLAILQVNMIVASATVDTLPNSMTLSPNALLPIPELSSNVHLGGNTDRRVTRAAIPI